MCLLYFYNYVKKVKWKVYIAIFKLEGEKKKSRIWEKVTGTNNVK